MRAKTVIRVLALNDSDGLKAGAEISDLPAPDQSFKSLSFGQQSGDNLNEFSTRHRGTTELRFAALPTCVQLKVGFVEN